MTLHRPWTGSAADEDTVVGLTPGDAGWDWTGLSVLRLVAGEPRIERMGAAESFVLPLAGSLTVEVAGDDGAFLGKFELAGREPVFAAEHGPSVAAPGYPMYYLNVMAGPAPDRALAFCDDPDHAWMRDNWADIPLDPRCPVTSAEGRVTSGEVGS